MKLVISSLVVALTLAFAPTATFAGGHGHGHGGHGHGGHGHGGHGHGGHGHGGHGHGGHTIYIPGVGYVVIGR